MSGYQLKLGIILVGCLSLLLAGCTNGYDQQTDPVDQRPQAVSDESDLNEPGGVFVVEELFEEDGTILAYLIPSDETGDLLDSAPPQFVELEGASVEIENGPNSTRSEATSEEIVKGDVIRLEMSESGIVDKIVIIR